MTTTTTHRPGIAPTLLERIDRISGCQGRWIVDCRELEGHAGYALRSLSDSSFWPAIPGPDDTLTYWRQLRPEGVKIGSLEDAARYCAATRWACKLLFSPELLDDDARWPGGYDAPSIVRSNARVFRDDFQRELELADGDADGLALDVRFCTDEMLETLEALESYPLLSEDDHSELELELIEEGWTSWAAQEWEQCCRNVLEAAATDDAPEDWEDSVMDAISADALRTLFETLREQENIYWEEQCYGMTSNGYWIDVERVAERLTSGDLLALAAEATP